MPCGCAYAAPRVPPTAIVPNALPLGISIADTVPSRSFVTYARGRCGSMATPYG
jgi:hypothetical protein